jgi:alcohol dehydrogenase, propanol-preferring
VLRAGSGADAAAVREITGGQGVGVVLDCVGNDATMALAAASVHPVSHIVVIGLGGGTMPFAYGALPFECSVSTTFWGGVTELREVVALAERGRVRLDVEHVALEDVGAAYERLADGDVRGRIVALPNG